MTDPILKIENVSKRFTRMPGLAERLVGKITGGGKPVTVHALSDVSLEVAKGEVLGVVGESGCGKSTLGRVVAGIYGPSDGGVTLNGKPVADERGGNVDKLTTQVQMIHQDPFASLNPRMKVGETLAEGPRFHKIIPARDVQYGSVNCSKSRLEAHMPTAFCTSSRAVSASVWPLRVRCYGTRSLCLMKQSRLWMCPFSAGAELFMDLRRDLA
ncbi:ATP-binding cassette domain-containing protein [Roseobacter sp. GAI101]|uniref:ATP-binding cassette domain-containing protein n=1 Tax=Roseobacter sp. (strain GAI101) TaxID=391589 RepID=UPI000187155E|nr:putative ABC transporter ATP-binding protein [Roseobacter sp. GAI101]